MPIRDHGPGTPFRKSWAEDAGPKTRAPAQPRHRSSFRRRRGSGQCALPTDALHTGGPSHTRGIPLTALSLKPAPEGLDPACPNSCESVPGRDLCPGPERPVFEPPIAGMCPGILGRAAPLGMHLPGGICRHASARPFRQPLQIPDVSAYSPTLSLWREKSSI